MLVFEWQKAYSQKIEDGIKILCVLDSLLKFVHDTFQKIKKKLEKIGAAQNCVTIITFK